MLRAGHARDKVDVVDAEGADDHADYNAVEGEEHGVYWSPLILFQSCITSPAREERAENVRRLEGA